MPVGFFSGLKIEQVSGETCTVSVPYKWFTQNPFRSIYFASLAMAAEMSTGVLAMANVYMQKTAISMLVVKLEAAYYKKAVGKTFFTCNDGSKFRQAVTAAVMTGESQTVVAEAHGVNSGGEAVAKFTITWSFKAKQVKV